MKEKEEKMEVALHMYQDEQEKPEHERKGLRKIAAECGVPKSTLSDRINGKQSIASFNATKQKLTVAEEDLLADFIAISSDRGCPLRHAAIARYANKILEAQHGAHNHEVVDKQWVQNFLERHREKLKTYWSKPLDSQRARCLNPEAVTDWFDLVYREIIEKGILPEDTYAMDESGFPARG